MRDGRKSRRWRVALAGYYGFGNLGDELLLRASLECLERCGVPRDAVVVLSNDPEGTARDCSVAAVSRWSLSEVRRALSGSETLLLGGGGLFQDSTSLRSCLWYWGLVRLARLCGARPWALGQSIGPLRTRAARWLARGALSSCSVLHVRDEPSMRWAGRLGLRAIRGEDLALTLSMPAASGAGEKTGKLLLNLRPVSNDEMAGFLALAAPCANAFRGEVIGVALSGEDLALMEQVRQGGGIRISRVVLAKGMEDIASLWSGAAAALGMRLHFAVLCALYRVPLAVLPYDPKVAAFAGRVGAPCISAPQDEFPGISWAVACCPQLPRTQEMLRADVDGLCRRVLAGEV
ncbi:MAG: polysaccharide pyruvyl transferase CsaB [Fretibacterium sp.]|nr:polysaccharide pyruvyl transferase CsaB [Fretibacterium sp.]